MWIWVGIWVATRALIVVNAGFWHHEHPINLEDVNVYHRWSEILANEHVIPNEDSWQYPPGAAFLMLIPRIGPASYGATFVGLMLIIDLDRPLDCWPCSGAGPATTPASGSG